MLQSLNAPLIGYTLNVVGLSFLASAITFKKPKREIEEILGVERPRSLSTVRDHLVNRVQVYIGFVFLVAGYILLIGNSMGTGPAGGTGAEDRGTVVVALVILGAAIGTMGVLKLAQLLFTRHKFRRLLAEVVRESSYSLERNQKVAVQIGELLQIPKTRDESVPEYITKVRQVLGLSGATDSRLERRLPRPVESPR